MRPACPMFALWVECSEARADLIRDGGCECGVQRHGVFVVAAGSVRVAEPGVGGAGAGMGPGLLILGAGFVSGGERGEVVNDSAAGLAGGVGSLPEAVVRARLAVPLAVLLKQREGVPVVLGSLAG